MFIALLLGLVAAVQCGDRPNILLFLTDDQDVFLDGFKPLAKTKSLIADEGTTYENAFVTTPVCCPSRASLLTGKYLHNTGAINNTVQGNCGGQTWIDTMEGTTFATKLQSAGYKTMYAGKYMNQYGSAAAGGLGQVPLGWSEWNALQGNSRYYNYNLSVNGLPEEHLEDYETDYLTDVIGRKAKTFLQNWDKVDPFLMVLGTPASHAPFTPAPQYNEEFSDLVSPRIPSYDVPAGEKHWFLRMEPQTLSESAKEAIDEVYRNRWRTLLSVDDLVSQTIQILEDLGELDNTYIVFTSDHGYHMGEFELSIDKRQPYEFDIRVPLVIRGPNIPKNSVSKVPALQIDLAPTFLEIAGLEDSTLDGLSLLNREDESRMFLIEYSGEGGLGVHPDCSQWDTGAFSFCNPEFDCKCQDTSNNTYTCLRRLESELDTIYCKFDDDEDYEEYYDISEDPYQLDNLAFILGDIIDEDRSLMAGLADCSGENCNIEARHVPDNAFRASKRQNDIRISEVKNPPIIDIL